MEPLLLLPLLLPKPLKLESNLELSLDSLPSPAEPLAEDHTDSAPEVEGPPESAEEARRFVLTSVEPLIPTDPVLLLSKISLED
jgi:hypothetical protein